MTLRPRRPRTGFTLIELLVVIGIIATLVGLLLAGVMRVMDSGSRSENLDRMAQVGQAITNAKTKNNMAYVWVGPFTLKARYAGNEPELELLTQMFPNMNTALNSPANENNGYAGTDVVFADSNQALVFLLTGGEITKYTGFSNNPKKPFLPAAAGESRKGPYLDANPKWFSATPNGVPSNGVPPNAQNGQAWLVDKYNTPFAVFATVKGKPNNYGTQSFTLTYPNEVPTTYTVTPFRNAATSKFVNESGFQIVSAGKDRKFGAGDAKLPAAVGVGEDDQANFSKGVLGAPDGIQ